MKVSKLLGISDTPEQEQSVPDFCLTKTKVGLEYEWENCKQFKSTVPVPGPGEHRGPTPFGSDEFIKAVDPYFDWHVDGSLRENGVEFTFKQGFAGSRILRATEAMDNLSRSYGFTGGYRTSLHVHIDMQDTTFPDDVESLGALYCVVEPFLYQFVGNGRNTSNYCIPWYKHPQHFENFRGTIKKHFVPDTTHVIPYLREHKGDKYAGLNCFAIGTFGTIEFRQAPVTMQRDKIITWINLIMRLKQWTKAHPMKPEEILERVNRMRPAIFLQEVFQTNFPDAVRTSKNIEADVWSGLETLYQYIACG